MFLGKLVSSVASPELGLGASLPLTIGTHGCHRKIDGGRTFALKKKKKKEKAPLRYDSHDIKFTFKVFNSVDFSLFTRLCNHRVYLLPEYSITPKDVLSP